MRIDTLFPWAAAPPRNPEGDFDFAAEGAADSADQAAAVDVPELPWVSMAKALHIPGFLHILNSATERLTERLQHWPEFVSQLTSVCNLVRHPWSQERLVQTCFDGRGEVFKGFSGQVYTGRWGSVAHAVTELSRVSEPLRVGWCRDQYLFGRANRAAERPDSTSITAVDEPIGSSFLWTYVAMVETIAATLLSLMEWVQGCPCHSRSPADLGPLRARQAEHERQRPVQPCPMRSRRAPEVVAGEFFQVLGNLHAIGNTWLSRLASRLPQEQRDLVLQDYAAARAHLAYYLRLKLAHWQFLPYTILGLGHASPQESRNCAAVCLALFDSMAPDHSHFPLTLELCTGPGRQQLELYAAGAPLDGLPLVHLVACKGRVVSIAERWIEGVHARVHRDVAAAPHHSAVHVAFMSIRQQLTDHLLRSPSDTQWFRDFANCCSEVRDVGRAVEKMGFSKHPALQELAGNRKLQSWRISTANRLCRCCTIVMASRCSPTGTPWRRPRQATRQGQRRRTFWQLAAQPATLWTTSGTFIRLSILHR